MNELTVEIAPDARARKLDPDVIPSPGLDLARHALADLAADLDGMSRITPAANVPPRLLLLVLNPEEDQESLGSAELPSLETERVIRPAFVACHGADVLP